MYDITDPATLYDLEDWMTDAYSKTSGDTTIIYALIGNKLDKSDSCLNSGRTFSAKYGIPEKLQFKISAAKESRESIRDILKVLAREIYTVQMNKEPEEESIGDGTILISPEKEAGSLEQEKRKCCEC